MRELGGAPRPAATTCRNCGAQSVAASDGRCPFCGGLLAGSGSKSERTDAHYAAVVTGHDATQAVGAWLRQTHEDALRDTGSRAKITDASGAYWPFYLLTGVYAGRQGNVGTVSGGFGETLLAGTEILTLRVDAPAFRFFAPPQPFVSQEDLTQRIMDDLFAELRGDEHLGFCEGLFHHQRAATLTAGPPPESEFAVLPFSESRIACEQRLAELLNSRKRVQDVYFTKIEAQRIYRPFWLVNYSYGERRFPVFVDAATPGGRHLGGYKPINPEKANINLRRLAEKDPDEIVEFLTNAGGTKTERKKGFTFTISGSAGDADSTCFIATAAYGTTCGDELTLLRRFRDDVLRRRRGGRRLVAMYERCSPPLADMIRARPALRRIVRICLRPVIALCRYVLN